ncbi:hypothetical protein HPB48_004339 [Haemaphysalis longicornis]|uniref:Cysteine dioxygenase n=1 Tax=Haemaphysalis longicornis TaxID=44386 RepID=A0A9J6G2W1_HAELO|nr:hypothetical protein HPB48_004339 [Haemaphysalis longicornis]
MKPPFAASLQDLISQLHHVFEADHINVEYVHDLMASYKSSSKEWQQYAKFDRHRREFCRIQNRFPVSRGRKQQPGKLFFFVAAVSPETIYTILKMDKQEEICHRYTRNLVDEGNGKFNLMILCWSEGQGSSIHDHADSHCFMKVLSGTLKEVRFAWPQTTDGVEAPMIKKGETELALNSVAYINDSLGLHRVENPSHCEPAVSLHLYCPPFDECSMFDQRTGHRSKSKVTFWSKYGERTPFVITPSEPEQYENN